MVPPDLRARDVDRLLAEDLDNARRLPGLPCQHRRHRASRRHRLEALQQPWAHRTVEVQQLRVRGASGDKRLDVADGGEFRPQCLERLEVPTTSPQLLALGNRHGVSREAAATPLLAELHEVAPDRQHPWRCRRAVEPQLVSVARVAPHPLLDLLAVLRLHPLLHVVHEDGPLEHTRHRIEAVEADARQTGEVDVLVHPRPAVLHGGHCVAVHVHVMQLDKVADDDDVRIQVDNALGNHRILRAAR
mmetsp:Transcript_46540/g.134071  ORF Transcript_46540/g.134071 Transcript_46540/m.134071 type:complete len:246 (+) Transcript_46540:320-1057(+)